jgi:hypothetical protein
MILQIDDTMTIEEVQDRFSECFPFLKIEFYSKPHKKFQPSDKRFMLDKRLRINQIRKEHFNGAIEIKSWHATAKIERELKDEFGLYVQIFRRDAVSGWVQTSLSDDFTLEQQSRFSTDPSINKS